jgi:ferrochelatase
MRYLRAMTGYDAVLLVSFGGPEGRDEVLPFLRNVVRGKNVPEDRLAQVAEHYYLFDGVSPLNGENRLLLEALGRELRGAGIDLPLYWGNRNWHPLLEDTVKAMAAAGVRRALAFVTSAYSSYSSCRQYLEDIERAQRGAGERAPRIEKIPPFFAHPGFLEANQARLQEALARVPPERREKAPILFTAHSIPLAMANGCEYARELAWVMSRVAEGLPNPKALVFQSRSGPASQPWLEPDIRDAMKDLARGGIREVVVAPIGFVSEHLEVVYDLDTEARQLGRELGIDLYRARTVSSHPLFARMARDLVVECFRTPPEACSSDCCPRARERVIE